MEGKPGMTAFKHFNLFIIIFLLVFVQYTYCYANEIEEKFIKAGLIDIHTIDKSIEVDLVNSDPYKNFFRENYYNGLK